MTRFLLSAVLVCLCGVAAAQVDTIWVRHFQYSPSLWSQSMATGRTMALDGSGNVCVGAYGQYATNDADAIILKYDSLGRLLWSASRDVGTGADFVRGIALDASGAVYAVGDGPVTGEQTVFVAKWSSAGVFQWLTKLRGDMASSLNRGNALVVNSSGVYATGTLVYSLTGPDMALVKLNPSDGSVTWTRTYSRSPLGSAVEGGNDVVLDPLGEVYVGGKSYAAGSGSDGTILRYDAAGNLLAQYSYNSSGNLEDGFARIALSGTSVLATGTASSDALICAVRNDGALLWARTYNGPGNGTDEGRDVRVDASGNVFVCGSAAGAGSQDMLTLKYASDGTFQWAKLYDVGLMTDAAFRLDLDASGNPVVTGGTYAGAPDAAQLVTIKYRSDGSVVWTYSFRPPGPAGLNFGANVLLRGSSVYVSGICHWGFPTYLDVTVMKLQEVPDVGVEAVLAPTGTLTPGVPVTPRADVRNYGTIAASVPVRFSIGDGYQADTTVILSAGGSAAVSFRNWTPAQTGYWVAKCSTRAPYDYNRANDSAWVLVRVSGPATDAGVRQIVAPQGNLTYQTAVIPSAYWHNFGTSAVSIRAYLFIEQGGARIYTAERLVAGVQPNGRDTLVEFPAWVAGTVGSLVVRCSTYLSGDATFSNDTMSRSFGVINQPVGNWTQMSDAPPGASARPVGQGGGMTGDDGYLYALRGNRTDEAMLYSIADNIWFALTDLPASPVGRKVGKGGALVTDGYGRLFATRGYKTFEFYRYDPVTEWQRLRDVPTGTSGKQLKGGTGIAYGMVNDTGFVYLLKGSGTNEFYRYNTITDTWIELTGAPAGASGRAQYKDGSALCSQNESIVFCLKAKYNEVFRFNTRALSWLPGQSLLPVSGSGGTNKKVKAGGSLAWGPGLLTALKGGNTCEFWHLDRADSVWREYPAVPRGVSGKKIKDGAGLVWAAGDAYVLKGTKTRELWRFRLNAADGQAGEPQGGFRAAIRVFPNPVNTELCVNLGGFAPGRVREMALYDVGGRLVRTVKLKAGVREVRLGLEGLVAGTYFVVASGGNHTAGCKVVITR